MCTSTRQMQYPIRMESRSILVSCVLLNANRNIDTDLTRPRCRHQIRISNKNVHCLPLFICKFNNLLHTWHYSINTIYVHCRKYIYNIYKSRKLLNLFAGALEKNRKRGSSLFHSECNLIIFIDHVRILCLSWNIKKVQNTC